MALPLPAFLQQPQLQGLVSSYPIDTNYIGSRWFPSADVASDEVLLNIEVPENPIAPFVTIDGTAPRDQEELITQIRASVAYIRFKKVFKESELRIFGLRDGNMPTLVGQMQAEAQAKILRHIARLRAAVDSRMEWMAINALTGAITYDDQRVKFSVNFPGIYTGGSTSFTKWDQAGADPISDVERWMEEMALVTGEQPSVIVGSRTVFRKMAGVTKFQTLATLFARAGNAATTITGGMVKGLLADYLGLEVVPYDARITDRSYDASGVPSISKSNILDAKHILLLPASAVGTMQTSPNPIDFGATGLYSWTEQEQDPWIVSTGVGINAFPEMRWPERVGYIQVLT